MDNLVVEVDGGFIEGEILNSELNGEPYRSFKGVPYARPPVGSLRFRPPEPVEKWNGVIQCREDKDMCSQKLFGPPPETFGGSEDCLYLNVYSPVENQSKSLRPVIVFIHGGGFMSGSGNSNFFGPDFIVPKGVVLVTPTYRVNIFGFLNLGIKECPGNAGLWDQRAALIWVKKHIVKFGGDPDNITLSGESAGSASAHYHLVSPQSKGLYHKVILQSGCCVDEWAHMDPNFSIDRAFRVGKYLGCQTTDVQELHKFLLNVPAGTLCKAIFRVITPEQFEAGLDLPFVPSKEIVGDLKDRFIPDDPKALVQDAPEVPVLCGINSLEGLLFYLVGGPDGLTKVLKNVESAIDTKLSEDIKRLAKDHARIEAAKSQVKRFYMKGDASCESVVANNYVNFFGDIKFYRGTHQMLKTYLNLSMRVPIFLYFYDYKSPAIWAERGIPDYFTGAGHGDDLKALFSRKSIWNSVSKSETCKRVSEHMTTVWTNFAKFGNPNGELQINWKPLSPNEFSYCKINENLKIQQGFIYEERMKFWEELHQSMAKQSQNGTL